MKKITIGVPKIDRPDRVNSYFRAEAKSLTAVTVSGIIYNIGLLAGPLFEGKLAQCLFDIFGGKKTFYDMLILAAVYIFIVAVVQGARYIKRLYVRVFANNVNRSMKSVIYGNLVHKSKNELDGENIGSVMTKAVSDVDACAEGMRKFTTEIFDTGVALICYTAMLFYYDWKLALLSLIFPPVSYFLAEKMKTVVQKSNAKYKESAGKLNSATLDRVSGAVTYRVFGCEKQREADYDEKLTDYEKKAVKANVWVSALPPLYRIISMTSALFIIYFGAKNVSGAGWNAWDIAAFTTFLSCYTKLSVKSSKAAKLFNAVHKAEVSWKRIRPLMKPVDNDKPLTESAPDELKAENFGFAYDEKMIFEGLSFTAHPGEIIGVTGSVACGKSTLGKAFLCEKPYLGSVKFGEKELSEYSKEELCSVVSYLGHDPEIMSDTVKNNILMGESKNTAPYLKTVCLSEEVNEMISGEETLVGSGGVMLSGGQQKRLALARTLCHRKPVIILDDPFSALDKKTETEIFENLKKDYNDCVIILISHRLYLFPQTDKIIWMENGKCEVSTHEELLNSNEQYRNLYNAQHEGGKHDEKK